MRRHDDLDDLPCFRGQQQAEEGDIPRRHRSGAATAWSTAIKSWWRSWAGTTSVPVTPVGGFKNCCLRSGRFDGSERNHYVRD